MELRSASNGGFSEADSKPINLQNEKPWVDVVSLVSDVNIIVTVNLVYLTISLSLLLKN